MSENDLLDWPACRFSLIRRKRVRRPIGVPLAWIPAPSRTLRSRSSRHRSATQTGGSLRSAEVRYALADYAHADGPADNICCRPSRFSMLTCMRHGIVASRQCHWCTEVETDGFVPPILIRLQFLIAR